jgi:2',3'-cyclic-nucleotide 2'-phosphodiesterase (5'-nucleotidase family)
LINGVRNSYSNVIVVDTGNSLYERTRISNLSGDLDLTSAKYSAKAMSEIKYDIVNVGQNDLAGGLDYLKEITKSANFTLMSANLFSAETMMPIFKATMVKEIGGKRIGFFGVMGGSTSGAHDVDTFIITDPESAAKKAVEELRKDCDLVVALLAMERVEANILAKKIPGIDLVITLSRPHPIPRPIEVGDTTMVASDKQGKRIGRVTVTFLGSNKKSYKGEILPAGLLVRRDRAISKVENEYYYWIKEHYPAVIGE